MDFGLQGRVALVTGGARGIGLAEGQALAAEGCVLALVDLDGEAAEAAAAGLRAAGARVEPFAGDAADEATARRVVDEVVRRCGRLDILVNNAGIGVKPAWPVADMPYEAWQRMLGVHMDSTFLWSRAAIPAMAAHGFGRIVNTSSMNFTGGGRPGVAHYSAAKAGIAGFTRTLAKEVGAMGITANAVAPGYVATDLIAGFTPQMHALLARQNPVGRTCRPDEVAAAVAFLCSRQAAFINGALLCIDGGRRDFAWEA
ncbi:SDR family NAD(P)-dependent oxidoreductase [Aquincola sp. MAHUQ-54]|uniref:SDR family NAD(P)-dependent oxidoreductase n=1 Tax=Aquincola agrisoli TaxID=3119538 RepID=A0AAW9QBH9_9BURK